MKNNDGLIRIREAINNINPAEKNAAAYILDHPHEIIHFSIKELASKSQSSQSAIIRLCKKIGFAGFTDLKIRVAGEIQSDDLFDLGYENNMTHNINASIIKKVSQNNIYSINNTLKIIDEEQIEEAIHYL